MKQKKKFKQRLYRHFVDNSCPNLLDKYKNEITSIILQNNFPKLDDHHLQPGVTCTCDLPRRTANEAPRPSSSTTPDEAPQASTYRNPYDNPQPSTSRTPDEDPQPRRRESTTAEDPGRGACLDDLMHDPGEDLDDDDDDDDDDEPEIIGELIDRDTTRQFLSRVHRYQITHITRIPNFNNVQEVNDCYPLTMALNLLQLNYHTSIESFKSRKKYYLRNWHPDKYNQRDHQLDQDLYTEITQKILNAIEIVEKFFSLRRYPPRN